MKEKGYKNAQIRLIRAQFFVQHVGILLASVKNGEDTKYLTPAHHTFQLKKV
jgi:hypothetical protein